MNPQTHAYLRELAEEFDESTNGVRVELNRLTDAGLLDAENEGRTKVYKANPKHPLFFDITSLVRKTVGIDQLVERVLSKIGRLEKAFITGDYARGVDSGIIDLVLVGCVDWAYLQQLVAGIEDLIGRKIRILIVTENEVADMRERLDLDHALVVWG